MWQEHNSPFREIVGARSVSISVEEAMGDQGIGKDLESQLIRILTPIGSHKAMGTAHGSRSIPLDFLPCVVGGSNCR